jgi:DNA-binding LacI/PurR family transcriptional regulator
MPNVSAATRERVLAAAAELDYTVSPLASGLVTGRIRAIGVVLPYAGRWFFAEVLRGIEEVLRERGYDLVLYVLADERRREDFFATLPLRRRVDGVIVVALPLDSREVAALRSLGVPLAGVGEPLVGTHTERVDDVAAARLAVQHLVNLGHRRIGCIGGDASGSGRFNTPGWRTQGYREALALAGIEVRPGWERDGSFTAVGGELAMTALLSQPGGAPTAVFCQSDEMAFGALRALRRSGLRCPQDISVVGLDDHELARAFDLTTVSQPVARQGAAAARWLLHRLDPPAGAPGEPGESGAPEEDAAPGESEASRYHEVRLVLRQTTGPPPSGV